MKTPPFLLAVALLFWGWQTDYFISSLVMALALEAARFVPWRWEAGNVEYNRVWDLCTVLVAGGAIYFYASEEITKSFAFAHWMPLFAFPIMLAQAWGVRELIEYRTFSLLLRRDRSGEWVGRGLNISYLYFALCLLSASATNVSRSWFYFAFVGVVSCVLWWNRPGRFSFYVWLLLLLMVAKAGYSTQANLREMQNSMENALGNWIAKYVRRDPSFRENRTAIGRIGKIKLSSRIVWRLETEKGQLPPPLLRETTFDEFRFFPNYNASVWSSNVKNEDFKALSIETDDTWTLLPEARRMRIITLSGYATKGHTILPLPLGTTQLRHLPATVVDYSRLGVVRAEDAPSLLVSQIVFGSSDSVDAPPGDTDLKVPNDEKEALEKIVRQLDLRGQPARVAMERISSWFSANFTYSTWIDKAHVDPDKIKTPLTMFLEKSRSGHCEYFATATVLLLRQAGFPARYATGFGVDEPGGRGYVVRERHAHAWCLVHRNGVWEDFDTTPASWDAIERERESWFQPIKDAWGRFWYEFNRWRQSEKTYRQYLMFLLIPLVFILMWRIVFSKNRRGGKRGMNGKDRERAWPGLDSEFYQIERRLAAFGLERFPGETLSEWTTRVARSGTVPVSDLGPALALHYRYRFDPEGIDPAERAALREEVRRWLASAPVRA